MCCSRESMSDAAAPPEGSTHVENPADQSSAAPITPDQAATQYSAWQPLFRSHVLRGKTLALPPAFVEYLLADGVYLADNTKALYATATPEVASSDEDSEEAIQPEGGGTADECEQSSTCGSDSDAGQDWTQMFPDLLRDIQAAVDDLGGKVVPKLNWSCPSDAVWVNPTGTLACENAEQVVLMLKSSDRVAHDLELLTLTSQPQSANPHTTQPQPAAPTSTSQPEPTAATSTAQPQHQPTHPQATLVLRKWHDLRPEREWRCFVRGGRLVGVCQRDPTQHFPQLCTATVIRDVVGTDTARQGSEPQPPGAAAPAADAEEEPAEAAAGPVAREARDLLTRFHAAHVRDTFPLQHYTYDVYISTNNTIKLIDFNPVGHTTSPLLFTWEELGLHDVAQGNTEATETTQTSPTTNSAGHQSAGSSMQGADGGMSVHVGGVDDSVDRVRVRVVPAASMVHPGQRLVCGMPFDMLGLQDSVESMISRMQGA